MARPILESVKELSEDYSNRTLNTRTYEKATVTNIAKVHIAIRDLMAHKNNVSLEQDPFTLLWITNCVLFSAVIAFLLCKGWRRGKNNFPREQERLRNGNERKVRDPAREIRKNLSTVQAELDKIRTNGKLTKKGIKNTKSYYENEASFLRQI